MKTIRLNNTIARTYANRGQHAEQVVRFTLTGKIEKADHVPFWVSGDCMDIQVKTARATVCRGTDIRAHVAMDSAHYYGYVTDNYSIMYLMTPDEWIEFAETFKTVTTESDPNGHHIKTRLKHESVSMRDWLEQRA